MRTAAECLLLLLWLRLAAFTLLGVLARRRPRGTVPVPVPVAVQPGEAAERLAVIVPAFNEATRIAATLQALRAQTRPADELLVVDDGSTDGTAAVAAAALAGVPGARLLRLPRNGGKAAALNAGLAASQSGLVVTVDADTLLARDALAQAVAGLGGAAAAAFNVDVALTGRWIERLQWQEYAAALNFERRAQAQLGAVAVLPGAACILRRSALPAPAFSERTRTEDADLTLQLQARGVKLAVIDAACAQTLAPQTACALLRQRVRWLAGHLQCLRHHLPAPRAAPRLRWLTLPNFTLTTLTAPLGLAALGVLALSPQAGWLSPGVAVSTSLALVYGQRALARARIDGLCFFVEPLLSGSLGLPVFIAALLSLARAAR